MLNEGPLIGTLICVLNPRLGVTLLLPVVPAVAWGTGQTARRRRRRRDASGGEGWGGSLMLNGRAMHCTALCRIPRPNGTVAAIQAQTPRRATDRCPPPLGTPPFALHNSSPRLLGLLTAPSFLRALHFDFCDKVMWSGGCVECGILGCG